MPHIKIEYTTAVKDSDAAQLQQALHQAALDCGHFPAGGVRTLLFPAANSLVARDNTDASFVFISVKILPGRTFEVRQEIGRFLFTAAEEALKHCFDAGAVGLQLELKELEPGLNFQRNNML